MKECTKCGAKIALETDTCPECGAVLSAPAAPAAHGEEDSDVRVYNLRKPRVISAAPPDDEDGDIKIAGPGGKSSTRKFEHEEIENIKKESPIKAPAPPSEKPQPVTKIKALRKFPGFNPQAALLAVLAAILAVAAIILLILAPTRSSFMSRRQLLTVISSTGGELKLYKNGRSVGTPGIKTGSISFSATNMSGSAIAVLTDGDSNSDLFYSSGKTIVSVCRDVLEVQIAAGSDSLVYLARERDGGHSLYLFNGQTSTHIAANAMPGACISPDGKTIAFSCYSDRNATEGVGYIWSGGKLQELGQDYYPLAVSDGGEYIYYHKKNGSEYALYVMNLKRGKTHKLSDSASSVYFSSDLSEIIFPDLGYVCLVRNGSDKLLIGEGDTASVLLPYGCPAISLSSNRVQGYILGTPSFKRTYVDCGNTLYYISRKDEIHSVTSGYSQVYLSSDTRTVFYLKNSKLRSVNGTHTDIMPETLAVDAVSFTVSADGRCVYYLDTDGELMSKTGSRNPVLLSEKPDISAVDNRNLFNGDSFIYYTGNELSIVENGSRRTYVFDIDRIESVNANKYCIYLTGRNGSEILYSISGDGKNYDRY